MMKALYKETRYLVIFFLIIVLDELYSCNHRSTYYLLYDVNPGEGFNLRRDVYIRMSNLIRVLREPEEFPFSFPESSSHTPGNWTLVLPAWGTLPHWFPKYVYQNNRSLASGLRWSTFFDIKSLNLLIPVIEFDEFLHEVSSSTDGPLIDKAFYLTHNYSKVALSDIPNIILDSPSLVEDRYGDYPLYCENKFTGVFKTTQTTYSGFYGDSRLNASNFKCLSGVLQAIQLAPFLSKLTQERKIKTVYLGSAESVINGHWSEWSPQYWTARRSMVFSKKLRSIGDEFRLKSLNSTDNNDGTIQLISWLHTTSSRVSGGPYVAVHWRRGDFGEYSPSARVAADQVIFALGQAFTDGSIPTWPLFISSDATEQEFAEFSSFFPSRPVLRFLVENFGYSDLSPGEIAIIDQWICAHASYFIGTNPSTFTFRIAEERQLMGYSSASTFNTLCKSGKPSLHIRKTTSPMEVSDCEYMSPWEVVYESRYTIQSQYGMNNTPGIHISNEL